ncbi:glycosyltransferase family 39 protein [Micromonospora sp. NPDC004704]
MTSVSGSATSRTVPTADGTASGSPPNVAWPALAAVAGTAGALMLAFSGRYGYHRDELYFLVAGRHPAWGYDDQPPLVPLLARLMDTVSGGSLVVLRLPSTIAVALGVLLVGLLAREFGGGRAAQLLAAVGWAAVPVVMISGHLLNTTPLDLLGWTTVGWLVTRWVRTRDDRLLLALGPVVGLGLQVKSLPLILVAALLGGVLVSGPRAVLRHPALWIAAVVALALWAPNLWWQATHGWPQLTMTGVIREDADFGGRAGLVPAQLLMLGPLLTPIWVAGLWRLLRSTDARPYRFLGWTYLLVLVVVLATGGREYYPIGAYPALVAAGAVATVGWLRRGVRPRLRRTGVVVLLAVHAVTTVGLALPVYPIRWLPDTPQAEVNYDAGETVGWPELAATVAGVHRELPPEERADAVVLTRNYGEAGALDRYGRPLGLPTPYSGHVNYWRWGPPPDSAQGPVIIVGRWNAEELDSYCGTVTLAARHDNGYGLENEEQGVPVWVCRDLTMPWSQLWPRLRRF